MRDLNYFISDLHLGARYHSRPLERERQICNWLRSIEPRCKGLYLLGDILDYWFEYRNVVPRGFVRFFGTLADMADKGVDIYWITGNHDIWFSDYLKNEIGMVLLKHPMVEYIEGKRFFLAHGDGLGPVPLGERIMRAVFHNRVLQRLYAAVHPRWTVGLAYGWSASNRSKHKKAEVSTAPLMEWVEKNQIAYIDYYIFGHYHTILETRVRESRVVILGDWIDNMSYAVFDGKDLKVEKVSFDN